MRGVGAAQLAQAAQRRRGHGRQRIAEARRGALASMGELIDLADALDADCRSRSWRALRPRRRSAVRSCGSRRVHRPAGPRRTTSRPTSVRKFQGRPRSAARKRVDDADHRIEREQPLPARRNDADRIDHRADVHPGLDHERNDVAKIAIRHRHRGQRQADAERGDDRQHAPAAARPARPSRARCRRRAIRQAKTTNETARSTRPPPTAAAGTNRRGR